MSGLFANEVLPLRAGELIRCFLMARWSKIPISVTMASALIERIFDGVFLIAGLFISLRYMRHFPLSRGQARAIQIITTGSVFLAILLLICALLLAVAMYWREQTLDALLDARLFSWAHVVYRGSASNRAFALSLSFRGGQRSLPADADRSDLRHHAGVWVRQRLLGAGRRAHGFAAARSVVPQAPGNVGLFQVLSTLGLTLFGVAGAMARRFTVILWAVVTVPLLMAGLYCAGGFRLEDGRSAARSASRDARPAGRNGQKLSER